AASSSASNPVAADGLLAAYHSAAAPASRTDSSRNSRARATLGRFVNSPTGVGPGHSRYCACIYGDETRANLVTPRGFGLRIDLMIEALDQLTSKSRPLLGRETQGLSEKMLRVHALS